MTSRIEAKLSRIPSTNPASTAPGKEPMPPTTTTTKLDHEEIHAHVIVGRVDRRVHNARQTRDGSGDAEHDGKAAVDVDAQEANSFTVRHTGTYNHPEGGKLQEGKHGTDQIIAEKQK